MINGDFNPRVTEPFGKSTRRFAVMTVRKLRLCLPLMLLVASVSGAQTRNKIDCKAQFKFSQTKIGFSVDVLKKIAGTVNLDPQTLGQVDKWTTVVLSQQLALCDAFKNGTEQTFPTTTYLAKLNELQLWEIDFFKLILTSQNLTEAKSGTKGGEEVAQLTSDIQAQIKSLVQNPPNVEPPVSGTKTAKKRRPRI
jgi:hypothetical protein